MARAAYQVLVIPFTLKHDEIKVCLFKRTDMKIWQFIAGGGEEGETPLQSAKREAKEEAQIPMTSKYYSLDTCCSIPAACFGIRNRKNWGDDCFVVPEYCFAVEVNTNRIDISDEHTVYTWLGIDEAFKELYYDSNKTALFELKERIEAFKLRSAE